MQWLPSIFRYLYFFILLIYGKGFIVNLGVDMATLMDRRIMVNLMYSTHNHFGSKETF
jgi:hypothetical protein